MRRFGAIREGSGKDSLKTGFIFPLGRWSVVGCAQVEPVVAAHRRWNMGYTVVASEARLRLTGVRAARVIVRRAQLQLGSFHLLRVIRFARSLPPAVVQLKSCLNGTRDCREGLKKIQDHVHRRSPP